MQCRVKKTCSISNCRRLHHVWLNDQSNYADDSVRPATASTGQSKTGQSRRKKTAIGMIQFDVLDADENTLKDNVFLDEGGDSTFFG